MKPLNHSPLRLVKLFVAFVLATATSSWVLCAEDVTIVKGSSTRIAVSEGVKKISVGSPSIIDAKPGEDGRSVLVSGLAEGSSELRVERLQGGDLVTKVFVRTDLGAMLEQIKELLSDVDGLDFKTVGSRVVIRGSVATQSDNEKVRKVADAYSGVVLDMTKFDNTGIDTLIVAAIQRDIGIDTVVPRIVGDTVILEGVVYSAADTARAVELAKLRMPKVQNLLSIQQLLIETDIEFVQVTADNSTDFGYNILKNLNINAQGSAQGANTGKPTLSWGAGASVSAKINALIANGKGKMVAHKNISTTSGMEGSAMVGGEFGITVSGNVGGNLEKVEFGLILKVKPVLQGRDSIVSTVTFEMSVPTARGPGGYTLEKSKTQTTVMGKVGESIVLSGLAQALGTSAKEKTPLLGDIPLLNLLFSEKTSRKEKKEVICVLTSRLITPQVATGVPFSEDRKKLLDDKEIKK